MDAVFVAHVESLRPQLEKLLAMDSVKPSSLPREMPKRGIYLLAEAGKDLYVGRSNDIRNRIGGHCRVGAKQGTAAFAFRLAREATGNLDATYKQGEGSREGLMKNAAFANAFIEAKARVRAMDLRFVEENDPIRQTLLEVYVAVVRSTPYNDFDNH